MARVDDSPVGRPLGNTGGVSEDRHVGLLEEVGQGARCHGHTHDYHGDASFSETSLPEQLSD